MNLAAFNRSVRSAFQVVLDLDLTSWDRQLSLRSFEPPVDYKRIVLDTESDYGTIFKAGLRHRAYNFLLKDYSYFQFWHDSTRQPRRLRYAYYPNPFELVTLDEAIVDELESHDVYAALSQVLDEASLALGKPPIRYDLALDDRVECDHPASHLTVGCHTKNRWPVSRILSPRLFVLFVTKHYYPEQWSQAGKGAVTTDGFSHQLDQAIATEKRSSQSLEDDHFSAKERLHLFIT